MKDQEIRCLMCGELAEEVHHVAGRRVDRGLVVDLCTACHDRTHRDVEEVGVQLDGTPRTMLQQLEGFLRALGAFFLALGARMLEWANLLAWLLGGGGTAPEAVS